jgi:putative phosphoesterase
MSVGTKLEPMERENDPSYCKFGIERLAKLLEAFKDQIGGVMESDDMEYVHRMRVASRRIRATMPLFKNCFPQNQFKRWLNEVKKVTRLLGEARDLDIQITFIKNYQSKNKSSTEDSITDLLLTSHMTKRAQVQSTVLKGLEKLQEASVLTDMQEFFDLTNNSLRKVRFVSSSVREKAFWAISSRLYDLTALERYVRQENAVLKHHEMRIRAKWLRYTMETFAPIYESKLTEEIETMKSFQDVLGEMHDCDVWINYLPKFMDKHNQDEGKQQSILKFLGYVKALRKSHYTRFVDLWAENKKKGFFKKLKETTNTGFFKVEDKIKELQSNPEAEVAVLADVHGNLHALQAVIENAEKRGVTFFLNAGDLTGFGPFPNEVIELLQSKHAISVIGNFDLEVLQKATKAKNESKIALEFVRDQISGSCRAYLRSLPREIRLKIAGKRILLTHGSPESIDEHLYSNTLPKRLKELAQKAKADVVITGHSHEQYTREAEGVFFINPGSVGRPGDGNPQAAYAVLKFNPFSVELLRVKYDVSAVADALRLQGLPESFSQMLLRGVAISQIAKEDRQRKDAMKSKCQKTTKNCGEISRQYHQDIGHFIHVRKLSLRLFDELQALHNFGNVERCWLECAAILHDIGLSETVKAHNEKSMKLILDDTRLILSSEDRRIIASIARYHRKSFPKKTHYNLLPLSPRTVKKIAFLSGILRLADGLDYSHTGVVKDLRLKIGSKKIIVDCAVSSNPMLEQHAFIKKKDLIEDVLKTKMVLAWKQL